EPDLQLGNAPVALHGRAGVALDGQAGVLVLQEGCVLNHDLPVGFDAGPVESGILSGEGQATKAAGSPGCVSGSCPAGGVSPRCPPPENWAVRANWAKFPEIDLPK